MFIKSRVVDMHLQAAKSLILLKVYCISVVDVNEAEVDNNRDMYRFVPSRRRIVTFLAHHDFFDYCAL